jgi:hypothetical protein
MRDCTGCSFQDQQGACSGKESVQPASGSFRKYRGRSQTIYDNASVQLEERIAR